MKKIIIITLIGLFSLSAVRAAETNTINSVANNTNITQAIVSILSGAKNVGGDIYDTSKVAIGQSVDFIKQQTPDIIEQFIKWKFCEAMIYTISGLIGIISLAILIWYLVYQLIKSNNLESLPFVGILVIPLFLCCRGLAHIMDACYIYCAPKVYLIDYIVSHLHK